MIRLLMLWMFFSSIVAAWLYFFNKKEKISIKKVLTKATVSGIIGALVVAALFLVNNISGV